MEQNKRTKAIFSPKLAGYLMQRGFVLITISPNTQDESKHVFYFNNTDVINDAIQEWRTINNK